MRHLVVCALLLFSTAMPSLAQELGSKPNKLMEEYLFSSTAPNVSAATAASAITIPAELDQSEGGDVWTGLKWVGRGIKNTWRPIVGNVLRYTGMVGAATGNFELAPATPLGNGILAGGQESRNAAQSPVTQVSNELRAPTREEVGVAGRRPYLRYEVPEGELETASNTMFSQPAYNSKTPDMLQGLSRGLAGELGLAGMEVWNEFPGQAAVKVRLSPMAVVMYQPTPNGPSLMYLGDCTFNGEPWANRIKPVRTPAPQQATVQAPQAQEPAQAPTVNFNTPAIPQPFQVNLTGFPQAQPYPAEITIRHINENKLHWSEIANNLGNTLFGPAALTAAFTFPNAMRDVAETNAGAARDVANITGNHNENVAHISATGRVEAADRIKIGMQTRNPDTTTITQTVDQVITSSSSSSSDGADAIVTANPVANGGVAIAKPVVTANGGEGGKAYANNEGVKASANTGGVNVGVKTDVDVDAKGGSVIGSGNSVNKNNNGNSIALDNSNKNVANADADASAASKSNSDATAVNDTTVKTGDVTMSQGQQQEQEQEQHNHPATEPCRPTCPRYGH